MVHSALSATSAAEEVGPAGRCPPSTRAAHAHHSFFRMSRQMAPVCDDTLGCQSRVVNCRCVCVRGEVLAFSLQQGSVRRGCILAAAQRLRARATRLHLGRHERVLLADGNVHGKQSALVGRALRPRDGACGGERRMGGRVGGARGRWWMRAARGRPTWASPPTTRAPRRHDNVGGMAPPHEDVAATAPARAVPPSSPHLPSGSCRRPRARRAHPTWRHRARSPAAPCAAARWTGPFGCV